MEPGLPGRAAHSSRPRHDGRRVPLLIGGELVDTVNWFESLNPSDETVTGVAAEASAADVGAAVDAAAEAQPAWAALGVVGRARLVRALAAELSTHAEDLVTLEVLDTGNTIARVRRDIDNAVESLHYFAGLGLEMKGETIPSTAEHLHMTLREPYGVVGRIVPFNHPFYFAVTRIAAPLMAGNTVVLKPPEQSALSSGVLARACLAVLPRGVVNIVNGPGSTVGSALVRHPAVRRIGFTGSVPTGLAIQRAAADSGVVKTLSLELGGKNPMIVFPDVDIERVCDAAVAGMNFSWAGQSCGSTSRLLVHHDIYGQVLDGVLERVRALQVGDPHDPDTGMGPLNSAEHLRRVRAGITAAVAEGNRLLTGGKRPAGDRFARGYWLEPTVFGDVDPRSRLAQDEMFGPVLSVIPWRDPREAVQIANGTQYGLAASIWTNDVNLALGTARAVHAGYVWVNGQSTHYPGMPFGGVKNSGTGRDENLDELLSYTEIKSLSIVLS
jgi:betaine-aldehyde dehydrogenase